MYDFIDDTDAVTKSMISLSKSFRLTILLYLLSYILIMINLITRKNYVNEILILFIPMFLGSIIGIYSIIQIIKTLCNPNMILISRERRIYMNSQLQYDEYIEYDSLPLMRLILFWCIIIGTFLSFAFITQVLFYFWLITGHLGMLHACIPLIIIFVIILSYLYLTLTLSFITTSMFGLLFIEFLLFIGKYNKSTSVNSIHWLFILIPLIVVQFVWLCHLIYVSIHFYYRKFLLDKSQVIALISYPISIILMILAEIIKINLDRHNNINSVAPEIFWMFSGILFSCSVLIIINNELEKISISKNYSEPLDIIKTTGGHWQIREDGIPFQSILLGTISRNKNINENIQPNSYFQYDHRK